MKRHGDRRKIERRAPKRGVNVRVTDDDAERYPPKRIKMARASRAR